MSGNGNGCRRKRGEKRLRNKWLNVIKSNMKTASVWINYIRNSIK